MTGRPAWCPHADCRFRVQSQDQICYGELPASVPHGAGINTHRVCRRGAKDDGEWTFDLQINRGDAWHERRLLDHVFRFASQAPGTKAGRGR